jgi:hypothetical protein
MNWTASIPGTGATVHIGGKWQECVKGRVYDIGEDGFWIASAEEPKVGWVKVGKVNYKYAGVIAVHIIIDVKNALTGKFDPIFVDSTALPPGSTATYQPQKNVIWWYQGAT